MAAIKARSAEDSDLSGAALENQTINGNTLKGAMQSTGSTLSSCGPGSVDFLPRIDTGECCHNNLACEHVAELHKPALAVYST